MRFIRTTISLPEDLLINAKKFNLNVSKICQQALEKQIQTETLKSDRKAHLKDIFKLYYDKGFEFARQKSKDFSKEDTDFFAATLKGEGRYGIWNLVDRVDDVFERTFDYGWFDDQFHVYDCGWVLKDQSVLTNPDYSWFSSNKPVDLFVQDCRAEALFEFKYGFAMGLCGLEKSISPSDDDFIVNKEYQQHNKLSKKQSLKLIRDQTDLQLNHQNTIFSNQNAANDLWWFEPSYEKLESGFFLILNNQKDRILYIFNVPGKKKNQFRDRPEKGRVSITIDSADTFNFMDQNSGSSNEKFSKYLIKKISY
jgi:hypothetical protein